ncbi:Protein piccolo [Labeo rohita]|uniref:Protein piccolo n=1 Tax=Labeo rohita TaxID=84645 RepID=A0ABQ8LYQ5_LABRO|nr:Protein piccolo [Labeo rohita]
MDYTFASASSLQNTSPPKNPAAVGTTIASMNQATSRLLRLRQGNRTIEEYVEDFCELCHLVNFNDVALKYLFRHGLNEPVHSGLPGGKIYWTLETYIDFALRLSGSPLTVGIAEEGPCSPTINTLSQPTHVTSTIPKPVQATSTKPRSANIMSAKLQPAHSTSAKPQPAPIMPAAPGPAHAMPAAPGPAHTMPACPESAPVMAAIPEPVHKMAAIPEPVHKMAAIPEPVHKMAAFPKPAHKMAAIPEPVHTMAAISKPLHKMATIPEPAANSQKPLPAVSSRTPPMVMMAHVLDSPLIAVWAAKMALHHVTAATPGSSQAKAAVLHESSQDTAVPHEFKPSHSCFPRAKPRYSCCSPWVKPRYSCCSP